MKNSNAAQPNPTKQHIYTIICACTIINRAVIYPDFQFNFIQKNKSMSKWHRLNLLNHSNEIYAASSQLFVCFFQTNKPINQPTAHQNIKAESQKARHWPHRRQSPRAERWGWENSPLPRRVDSPQSPQWTPGWPKELKQRTAGLCSQDFFVEKVLRSLEQRLFS